MQYKAIISFSGKISMASGQVSEISDESLAKDLLKAGYIIPNVADNKTEQFETEKVETETVEKKEVKPKTKRKGKTNEN